jgi:hypothetical protein
MDPKGSGSITLVIREEDKNENEQIGATINGAWHPALFMVLANAKPKKGCRSA